MILSINVTPISLIKKFFKGMNIHKIQSLSKDKNFTITIESKCTLYFNASKI